GLFKPLSGRIALRGLRARDIAYLPQIAEIDRSLQIDVYDVVAMGLWHKAGAFGGSRGGHREALHPAVARVGVTDFDQRSIGTLSGGQMQRALFARLLLQDAQLIVLDEPFAAIDAKTAADLLDIVKRWHSESRTVLAALHDLELVKSSFPEALLLA